MSILPFLSLVNIPQFHRSCRGQGISMADRGHYLSACLVSQLQWGDVKWLSGCCTCIEFASLLRNPKLKNSKSSDSITGTRAPHVPQRKTLFLLLWAANKSLLWRETLPPYFRTVCYVDIFVKLSRAKPINVFFQKTCRKVTYS